MSAVLIQQLTYLLGTRKRLYRPLQWRSILPIKTGIPKWAQNVQIYKITENSNEPVPHQIGNQKAPIPSVDRTGGSLKLMSFDLMYQIWDEDLTRKQVTGIDVEASSVLANQRAFEEFLDGIASIGSSKYTLPGLLNSGDVDIVSINGAWATLITAANTNDLMVAALKKITNDIGDLLYRIRTNSKNALSGTAVVIPDAKYQLLTQNFHPTSGASFLELIQKAFPGVRFVPWYRCNTAGAGSATRMCAGDFTEDVLSMLMVNEITDGAPLRVHAGYEVLQNVGTGGVLIEQPQGLAYADGV